MRELEARAKELKRNLDIISSYFQSLLAESSGVGLSLQELKTIDFIGERRAPIMREASEHLKVAVSTVTSIIDKLESKDLVVRQRNDEDRRIIKIVLTPEGEKVHRSYVESYLRLSRGMLRALDDAEQVSYMELTKKIAKGAGACVTSAAEKKN